jgi:predicted phosphodiesterase
MRRTKGISPATAILTADIHVTENTPVCRTDDYLAAQEKKLAFLSKLSEENMSCPVINAGDLFEHWKVSPWFACWTFLNLPRPIITIPGNHDLPNHSLEKYDKSVLNLMEKVLDGDLIVLKNKRIIPVANLDIYGIPFGEDLDPKKLPWGEKRPGHPRRMLLLHENTWQGRQKPKWDTEGYTSDELLALYGTYVDVIVVGHNHDSFLVEKEGVLLVNPGSMLRRTADQADFRPRCFLYYAKTNKIVPVKYPIEEGVVSQEHLERKKQHEQRTAAYIDRVNQRWKKGLSFKDNLEAFFSTNNTPRKVREILWQHLGQ